MEKDKTKKKIAVMQAYLDGKKIQGISADRFQTDPDSWVTFEVDEPLWDWVNCNYRIKPNNTNEESEDNGI